MFMQGYVEKPAGRQPGSSEHILENNIKINLK